MATLLRIAALLFLLSVIRSQPVLVFLTTPLQLETQQPHLCVHTRLMEEVEEWKIQRTLMLVREMGAPTIVEFFPWAYLQPLRDRFDWTSADRIIRHAQNQGIRVIARMGLVPEWARPSGAERETTLNELPTESFPAFARFVAEFAQRYRGTIDHLIIWNEPNLSFEWGFRPVSAREYVDMLRVVYATVKASVPEVQIISAPLAPTLEPRGSPNGLDDLIYLEDMYSAGMAEVSDAVAMHTYGFLAPPTDAPSPLLLNYRRAELLYAVMQRAGDSSPVYITETGWNDNSRWAKAVTPSLRISYTLDGLAFGEAAWDWVETICLWVMRFPAPTGSYPDGFTLISPDFVAQPIYRALQSYGRGWETQENLWLPPPASG